jgi:hypothetical protein
LATAVLTNKRFARAPPRPDSVGRDLRAGGERKVEFTKLTRRGREKVREVFTGRRPSTLTPEELSAARRAGYEPSGDDSLIGRDPREMERSEIEAMGHQPMSPMGAIPAGGGRHRGTNAAVQ